MVGRQHPPGTGALGQPRAVRRAWGWARLTARSRGFETRRAWATHARTMAGGGRDERPSRRDARRPSRIRRADRSLQPSSAAETDRKRRFAAGPCTDSVPTMSDGLGTRLDRLRSYYRFATLFYTEIRLRRWAPGVSGGSGGGAGLASSRQ